MVVFVWILAYVCGVHSLSGYRVNHCVDGATPFDLGREGRAPFRRPRRMTLCAHVWPIWNGQGHVPNVVVPPPTFIFVRLRMLTMAVDDGLGISSLASSIFFDLLVLHLYVGYFVSVERLLFGALLIYKFGRTK